MEVGYTSMWIIRVRILIALAVTLILFVGCWEGQSKQKKTGGPYYFKSWASYQLPYRPMGELSAKEAKYLSVYYEAFYDENGRILSFAKFFRGVIEWKASYYYDSNGSFRQETVSPDEPKKVVYFDQRGNVIKQESK